MSSPSRTFSVVDQALSLQVRVEKKRMEGFTSIRLGLTSQCLHEPNILRSHLCAKQIGVHKIEISDFDMYNKETQHREHFDESNYTKDSFYPDTQRQLAVIKANFDRTQKSCFLMREVMKKIYQQENMGFIQTDLLLTTKAKQKVEQLFAQGYLAYITVKVDFYVDEPLVAGQFYRSSEGAYFFTKSNKVSYARALFPCLNFIDDYYRVSKLRVVTDYNGATVISMGKLVSHEQVGNREIGRASCR